MANEAPKTCLSCPSYITDPNVQIQKFKRTLGAPMCGRFGRVLGRPGTKKEQEAKLARLFAAECDGYGKELPVQPVTREFQVALPNPTLRADMGAVIDEPMKNACTTCSMCKNFVSENTVANELGWTAGLCSAYGKLILANQQTIIGRSCPSRQFGSIQHTTHEVTLLPEYTDAFSLNSDPIKQYFANKKNGVIEPHEYPTDRDTTPDEEASGIRAWRRVLDPDGSGNEVFLPIYNIDHFTPEEQSKIPRTGQDEHPEMYVDHFGGLYLAAVAWTELDETPAAWGQAGVGKTELFRHLAWLMCLPFERISITGETELDDLAGKMHFNPEQGTYFQYGRLPLAWGKPCVICIDEPNVGPPDVWQFLRPLTDNSKQLVLDMNRGERISRHTDAYLGMAMNPAWDVKNVGAAQIGDADASRLFHVFIEMPPPELEKEIIKNRVALDGWEMTKDQIEMLMRIAAELRGLVDDGTLPVTWGVRPQIKVARALRWFEPLTAYRRAVGDYLEPEAQKILLDTVRAHLT